MRPGQNKDKADAAFFMIITGAAIAWIRLIYDIFINIFGS